MNTENYEVEENLLPKILEAVDIFLQANDYNVREHYIFEDINYAYELCEIAANLGLMTPEIWGKIAEKFDLLRLESFYIASKQGLFSLEEQKDLLENLNNFTFFPINEEGGTNKEKLSYLINNGELNKEELSRLIEEGKAINGKEPEELRAKALKFYKEVINKYGSLLNNNENMSVNQEQ